MKKTIPAYRLALLALPLSSSTLPLPVCLAAISAMSVVAVPACVTVNVNFPESAAQKATDDYVRDLYRARERSKPTATGAFFEAIRKLSLISEAHAQEETFKLDSSKTASIKEKLKSRVDDVITYKRSGVLGESAKGKLVLKDASKLKTLQKSRVETLVKEENANRDDLYEEVLKINQLPATRLSNIQSSFARSFQAESPSGTWLENPDGQWAQKP